MTGLMEIRCPVQAAAREKKVRTQVSWSLIAFAAVFAIVNGWYLTSQRDQRQAAEAQAKLAGLRAELIVASDPIAIVMCGDNGIISVCNQAALQLFGWKQEELIGQPITAMMPEDQRAKHDQMYQKAVDELRGMKDDWIVQRTDLPTTGLCKDQRTLPIYLSIRMIKYGGKIEFVAAMRPQEKSSVRQATKVEEPLQLIKRD